MVELRIDLLGADSEAVRDLVARSSIPCIVTCRATWEGGQCELPEEDRLSLLRDVASTNAAYIDVELASKQVSSFTSDPRDIRAGVIASSHDFSGRPSR